MTFRKWMALSITVGALVGIWACGKNLTQVFFHPSVDTRVAESISGNLPVPGPISPVDPNLFSFAIMGDVQIRSEAKTYLTRFQQDVGPKSISFFVVLGDLTEDGTPDEFAKIKTALDGVGIPYYATIGNHDLFQDPTKGGWSSWKSTFGSATYSVTIAGAVKFIFLDTASGEIGPRQFDWLNGQLTSLPAFTFVGSHYPIYDGITPSMFRLSSVEERYKLTSMLNRRGVYAYIAGHVHGYRQAQTGRVAQFTVGSMYPYDLDFGVHGYVLFTYDHGAMSWQRVEWPDAP